MIIYLYWPGGQTALHFAVVAGNLDMVVLLVEKFGADLLAEDDHSLTALDLALTRAEAGVGGDASQRILEYLRRTNELLPVF